MNSVNPYNMNYYDKYISKKTNDELRESEEKELLKMRKLNMGANAQLPKIEKSSSIMCKNLNKDYETNIKQEETKREEIKKSIQESKNEVEKYKEKIRDDYVDRKEDLKQNKQRIVIQTGTGLAGALARSFY